MDTGRLKAEGSMSQPKRSGMTCLHIQEVYLELKLLTRLIDYLINHQLI